MQQLHYQREKTPLALFPIVCYGADVIKIVYLKRKAGILEMCSLELMETENFVPIFVRSHGVTSEKGNLAPPNLIILQIQ